MISILIVDDESAARKKIARFLEPHEDCKILGEASNGAEAVDRIRSQAPDLIFLDVNMPKFDGFEVMNQIEEGKRPRVVFTTAYSDRAVRAFEINAVDYLLKPFDRARFDKALDRVREMTTPDAAESGREDMLRALSMLTPKTYTSRLMVQEDGKVVVVPVAEINWIEAAANYVVLHTTTGSQIMRTPLAGLLQKLDPNQFCRIHRGHAVHIARIAELETWAKGDMVVVLQNGEKIRLSRRYKDALFAAMQS